MAGNEIKGEMIRGHVDTFILLSLCNGDKDSNEIKEAIEERSTCLTSISLLPVSKINWFLRSSPLKRV